MEKKGNGTMLSPVLSYLVQREVSKFLKNEQLGTEQVKFAHIPEFACNFCSNLNNASNITSECWIIDTGATSHVCACEKKFKILKTLDKTIVIHMFDGSIKIVNKYVDVYLITSFIHKNVLYVPSFKYNLLSFGKILQERTIMGCLFYMF